MSLYFNWRYQEGFEVSGISFSFCRHQVPTNVQELADRGIFLFNHLLHNHHFLCLLVNAIESNRSIDARARSHIASLLSIILHPDMEYFTE